jgi:hypothetical protein
MSRRCLASFRLVLAVVPAFFCAARSGSADEVAEPFYDWYSVPLEVSDLPAGVPCTPVTCKVSFSKLLEALGVTGVVDDRSLRIYEALPGGRETKVHMQYIPDDQPRVKERKFLPATVPKVSYITELKAGEAPEIPQIGGTLWWIAGSREDGRGNYRLEFGVPRRGRSIQVPYAPRNMRVFDETDRATTPVDFDTMQIRPKWPLAGKLNILEVRNQASLVTTYHIGPTLAEKPDPVLRRPFFYPVNGPHGIALTEFGKAHDPTGSHRHHYSLWIAHANVAGQNFWSDRGGVIAHKQWQVLEDGHAFCRLVQMTVWNNDGQAFLCETRCMTVYSQDAILGRMMDFELEYAPAGAEPVELGKTTFGFLAVRVAASMTPFDGGGEILNSEGQRNEQNVHLQRARWLDMSGPVQESRWNGIAVLDHPGNPHHPTVWHCRNDGWAGASFNAEQPYTIEPDRPLKLRYRLILHAGNAANALVEQQWRAFAAEPSVRFGKPQRVEH